MDILFALGIVLALPFSFLNAGLALFGSVLKPILSLLQVFSGSGIFGGLLGGGTGQG